MKLVVALTFSIFLFGCAMAKNPVPEGYLGPTATISDSGTSGNFARMFYLTAVDEKGIPNSYDASQAASRGQGFALTTKFVTRRIKAKPQRVKLVGTHVSPTSAVRRVKLLIFHNLRSKVVTTKYVFQIFGASSVLAFAKGSSDEHPAFPRVAA